MIGKNVDTYCSEDLKLIENYDKAVSDPYQIWEMHHRLEDSYTRKELIKAGLYYNRPANELIFLTRDDHNKLHKHALGMKHSEETKQLMSIHRKNHSTWWNNGIEEVRGDVCPEGFTKGRFKRTAEQNAKTSASLVGMHWWNNGTINIRARECPEGCIAGQIIHKLPDKEVFGKKISKKLTGLKFWNNGKINKRAYECPEGFVAGRIKINNKQQ